jgi:hypothetical protein
MVNQNNIRVIFTLKSDSALSDIIKKYNLEEYSAMVKIDYISKAFVAEKVLEKDMSDYLQKELKVSLQIAKQVSKEIIDNIIPCLVKAPEEKFKDPNFIEEISKKVFGEEKKKEILKSDILPKVKPPIGTTTEILDKKILQTEKKSSDETMPTLKKQEKIKKPVVLKDIKEFIPQLKQSKGPNKYREPIE